MVRVSVFLLATAIIFAPAVSSTSAQTVKPAPKCANGLPEWANDAFAGRRGSVAFRCDQSVQSPQAAPKAPRPAAQARAKQAPSTPAAEPVAKKEAAAPAEPVKTTEQATKSAEPAAKAGTKPLCRRYLASTGQTVEVPCS
jgi:hypothetical protein